MKAEIEKIIRDNLPEATAKEMKKYLEEAEGIKAQLEEADAHIKVQNTLMAAKDVSLGLLEAKVQTDEAMNAQGEALEKREMEVADREHNIKLEIAEIKLNAAIGSNHAVMGLVDKVFGHPSVTVSRTKEIPVRIPAENGCSGWVAKENCNESETTTEGKS